MSRVRQATYSGSCGTYGANRSRRWWRRWHWDDGTYWSDGTDRAIGARPNRAYGTNGWNRANRAIGARPNRADRASDSRNDRRVLAWR